jgi:GT2 family glycosyltransferase
MQADYHKVVIVILNWNGLLDTLECLRSIQKITYPNFRVLVIDNGSEGNDAEIIRMKFEDFVCLIKIEKNIGFTGGANVGIRWALCNGAKYVLLLNNDTVVDPNFLTELVNVFQNDLQIGVVTPKIYYYGQPNRIYSAGGRVNFWTGKTPIIGQGEIDEGQFDTIEEVDYVGMIMMKEKTINTIGLFSQIYFTYYSDADWCVKAKKAGFKVVYAPKAIIWHKSHDLKTSGAKASVVYYAARNRFLFMKRNSNSLQFIFFNLYFLAVDSWLQIMKLSMSPTLVVEYIKGTCAGVYSLSHH